MPEYVPQAGDVIWDATPGVLYELGWTQCKDCKSWHQISEEFLELVETRKQKDELPKEGFVAIPDEGTMGPGSTCPDCGGVMGHWLPDNAIGERVDGTLILKEDT